MPDVKIIWIFLLVTQPYFSPLSVTGHSHIRLESDKGVPVSRLPPPSCANSSPVSDEVRTSSLDIGDSLPVIRTIMEYPPNRKPGLIVPNSLTTSRGDPGWPDHKKPGYPKLTSLLPHPDLFTILSSLLFLFNEIILQSFVTLMISPGFCHQQLTKSELKQNIQNTLFPLSRVVTWRIVSWVSGR